MKTLLKCLLAVITVTILMYLVGCFIEGSQDVFSWNRDVKCLVSLLWIIVGGITLLFTYEKSKKY